MASALLAAAFGCSESSSAKTSADSAGNEKTATRPVKIPQVMAVIPTGTRLRLSLIDSLDSNQSSSGDRFTGNLAESVVINGKTILSQGTLLHGRVVDAQGAGKVKGRASIRLELTDIVQGNRTVAITTDTFSATADPTHGRDAGIVAGGAGIGAAIGAIAGGKKGAGIGAITGGGAGTGVVLATKGNEIHYGPETNLNFTLTTSVKL